MSAMHGPRNPTCPKGPAQDVVRTYLGTYIRQQEFEDGWIYEISVPVDHDRLVTWRETLRILVGAQLLSTHIEEGRRYLGFWFTTEAHARVYPHGPLEYRYFDERAMAEARAFTDRWLDHSTPPAPAPNGPAAPPALRLAV